MVQFEGDEQPEIGQDHLTSLRWAHARCPHKRASLYSEMIQQFSHYETKFIAILDVFCHDRYAFIPNPS